ncbi:hypothetical protein, partial [Methylorubrum podarium]|uniref:hypothetical protein n=1 Tax=Methylorubrum podarium TaxID=200476 RepID=UPI001EE2F5D3
IWYTRYQCAVRYTLHRNAPTDLPAMIALVILATAAANVILVALLAERFGIEGSAHASAGELVSLQAADRAPASAVTYTLANENTVAATKIAA